MVGSGRGHAKGGAVSRIMRAWVPAGWAATREEDEDEAPMDGDHSDGRQHYASHVIRYSSVSVVCVCARGVSCVCALTDHCLHAMAVWCVTVRERV